ncbi:uncharacterized protein LOC117222085 isoform X2 [Megalopta genalis]|uniref:uncharacterized protein LOC117222085 isoform X2 n=1 Tax=Megalopta genalis TaxID=115081 RepID=UPI003FD39E99
MSGRSINTLDFLLDESVPVSSQSKEAYKKCMSGEAIYYGAIPLGLLSYVSINAICNYKKLGLVGKAISLSFGVFGYNVGKVSYAGNCAKKYVPEFPELMRAKIDAIHRRRDQYMNQIEGEHWTEDQATSSNYDTSFDDNSNQFSDDNIDISSDTLETDKPINLKQHTTYEELRRQNRKVYYGQAPYYQSRRPVEQKKPVKDMELLEDDSTFIMEDMK